MFENGMSPFQSIQALGNSHAENIHTRRHNTALSQFRSILRKGKIFRLKRRLLNARESLYDLNALKPDLHVEGSFYSGIRVVPIDAIIGSEGRTADFDMGFHPLNESARDRWVSMAVAYLERLPLPPIELIQVGNVYFVRDGHHRLSVCRAFGQIAMDAEVTTWQASGPFPWQADEHRETPYLWKKLNLST
jgi:hypothetical protein